MARNVEIKARVQDVGEQRARAAAIAGGGPEVIVQEDVYFNVPRGRLKLRFFSATRGELIFYQRSDVAGPKASSYTLVETPSPHQLRQVLEAAYGVRSIVRKTRELYLAGRTRIHIDQVESLGHFLELEVVLGESEDPRGGEREALELMERLGIDRGQLVEGSYVDLLESGA